MTDPFKKRLLEALEACEAIQEFTEARSFQEYERNLMLRSAIERQLEIVGEALGQAADEEKTLEEDIPAIPRIVSLRNRVIHGYDSVDDEIVLDIVLSESRYQNQGRPSLQACLGAHPPERVGSPWRQMGSQSS
jgi:uncharacterized protein with HEPN domain